MILLPRVHIAADFLQSAVLRLNSSTDADCRLMLVELASAAWGFVCCRPTHASGFVAPPSPFGGVSFSHVCGAHTDFEGRLDDILTLQALQDSASAVLLGGVTPSADVCLAYFRETTRILRPFLRDHLSLSFRDVLPEAVVAILEAAPKPEGQEWEPLPAEATAIITKRISGGAPAERLLATYSQFLEAILALAKSLGLPDGPLKETVRHIAHRRNVREGKIDKDMKYVFIARSRAQNKSAEVTEQDADNYLKHVYSVFRTFRYTIQ